MTALLKTASASLALLASSSLAFAHHEGPAEASAATLIWLVAGLATLFAVGFHARRTRT